MSFKIVLVLLTTFSLVAEFAGNPLKFPDDTSVSQNSESPDVTPEARFHHHHQHKKKKKKKPGCGGHFNNRFKRADPEGRFFFPILNIYDTDVYVGSGPHGAGGGTGCGSGFGSGSLPGFGSGLAGSLGGITGGLGSGLANLGSGLGSIGNGIGSTLGSLGSGLPSIGSGIQPIGFPSGGGSPISGGSPVSGVSPSVSPSLPPRPPPPVSTTDPDGDNEDYDYTDFSTTVRSRPVGNRRPASSLSNYPIVNSLSNGIRPVLQRPQTYFNQYVVRPINRTIREFYSLF